MSPISRNLRRLRKERGLSQYDLAEMSGISQRMINHYENYAATPPVEKLKVIAKALNVKMSALLEDPEENDDLDAALFDTRSLKKMRDILELPPNDRSFLYRTLNNLVRKNQLERASAKQKTETKESR
jgi:transcriptional regulator with XRE-family HTH domain